MTDKGYDELYSGLAQHQPALNNSFKKAQDYGRTTDSIRMEEKLDRIIALLEELKARG